MRPYRSAKVTHGPSASIARSLWMAAGVERKDFGKPVIAVANSFTEFVPGHVHLQEVGRLVCDAIRAAGGIPREFNTIAVDDGIAMGHDGMLYSLPSRDLIADSIEYMCRAHCVDGLICLSNCDKITPGMLMAGLRLNIPTVYVSGGPMEAGRIGGPDTMRRTDAIEAYAASVNPTATLAEPDALEDAACPTCGSCSGMFTANSMNCLAEAIGLALPGNGSLLATHADRKDLFERAAARVVEITRLHYETEDDSVLPLSIATRAAFENAMTVDIAMGGSTNTILHLLAMAQEAEVDYTMDDMDALSRRVPHICKVSPANMTYYMEDVHRAGGIMGIIGELQRGGLIDTSVGSILGGTLAEVLAKWDIQRSSDPEVNRFFRAAPGGRRTIKAYGQNMRWREMDLDRANGCIRDLEHAYSSDGGLAILKGNIASAGCVVKSAAIPAQSHRWMGRAKVFDDQEAALAAIDGGEIQPGTAVIVRYEGPSGGPGMQEMLKPTMSLKAMKLDDTCALITDGRFSGGSAGLSIGHVSPEAAGEIALVEDGDEIRIDIPGRSIELLVPEAALIARRAAMEARPEKERWKPMAERPRHISPALRAYAHFATSADKGGFRRVP